MHMAASLGRPCLAKSACCPSRGLLRKPSTGSLNRPRAVAPAVESVESWLEHQNAPQEFLKLQEVDIDGRKIDVTVATQDLQAGQTVLQIPDELVVTLDRVFEDETVAEVLTTDKLSELACLTLYMMYEKKRGEESEWYSYIKELDRQRARGALAAESPLLWTDEEVRTFLKGSPMLSAVKERLASIKQEYEALDTVWFMSGSLFNKYPYDVPTEAFSFEIFRQAFAAVQASVVHLQNVPLARRFALLPLGPPCLTYSSTCRALFKHSDEESAVQLTVDRAYAAGERVVAWCGPQPNSKLLLNYGIVDESNPYDKMPLQGMLPTADPLFQVKRRLLETADLATKYSFQLQSSKGLPEKLLPFLRVCYCKDADKLQTIDLQNTGDVTEEDGPLLLHLVLVLQQRLAKYERTMQQDEELVRQPETSVRQRVACRLLLCEKRVLHDALDAVMALPHAPTSSSILGCAVGSLEESSKIVQMQ